MDLGPQYKRDDAFTARMRFHQSWYRASILGVPYGTGPQAHRTAKRGSMLTKEDGGRGLNFLSPEIAALATARQRAFPRGIEPHRLFCNMLSSQPMCFNLFAPIAIDRQVGSALVNAMLGGVAVSKIRRVVFEHSPTPHNDYLGDSTAFDAFVEFELSDGALGFMGIETKLTEPFSRETYQIDSRPLYRKWVEHPEAPWDPDRRESLSDPVYNQLWRDHALAFALRTKHRDRISYGALTLVRHSLDEKCQRAVQAYTDCLRPGDSGFFDRTLDDLVRRWKPVVDGTAWQGWLDEFETRYVNLTPSEVLWDAKQ